MAFDWENGGLAEGLRCYRSRDFFLAHEHWEDVWRECAGQERMFLQALIQIAVAMHHFSRGNRAGAASLLRRSLNKLEKFPAAFGGVEVEPLRENIRAWLSALGNLADREIPAPTIR
jgi:uncharacterized protein